MRIHSSWAFLPITLYSLSAFAQQPAPESPSQAPQVTAPGPQRQQPPSGRPEGANKETANTNADVIRMTKAGVPESAIIALIKTKPHKFDLSPDALVALHRAGVGQEILEAMMATGGNKTSSPGAQNAGEPDGPSGRKTAKLTPEQSKALLAKLKAKPVHLSPMITNSPPQAEAAIVAMLVRQKQSVHPGQIMSSTGDPAGGQTTPPATPGTPGGNPAGSPPNAGGLQKSSPSPVTPSTQVGSSTKSNSALSSRAVAPVMAAAPQTSASSGTNRMLVNNTLVLNGCNILNGPPVVSGLGGEKFGVNVFSQDPAYNPFYVDGCHFGTAGGQAYLKNSAGQKIADLQINKWTDTLVTVTADPSLVDVFDQDNVSLVIVASGGQQGQKAGFKFYARRRDILLPSVPASHVSLAQITDTGGNNVSPTYSSPYQGTAYSIAIQTHLTQAVAIAEGLNADKGMTAGADRNATYRFGGGTDAYDFGTLKPGFYVSKFQIDERTTPVCYPGVGFDIGFSDETVYDDGSWNAQYSLTENKIRVTFAEQHCHYNHDGSDSSNSTYALNIWITGPAISPGNTPWQ
jgi:hypothetical protein